MLGLASGAFKDFRPRGANTCFGGVDGEAVGLIGRTDPRFCFFFPPVINSLLLPVSANFT